METEIIKGRSDKNSYRYLTLENGVRVVLATKEGLEHASAALSVTAGDKDNGGVLGMAHFTEHLLFMGTEKYPDEKEYSSFFAEHGGTCNAYTGYTHTVYYFDVIAERLNDALDRFVQLFSAPLLSEDACKREMLSVDSEHKMYSNEDCWRLAQIIKSTGDKDHPYNKFSVGNKETLSVPAETVRAFFKNNYTPDRMGLVVYGNQPLDELEEKARLTFGKIPANRSPRQPTVHSLPTPDSHCQKIFYKSRKKKTRLSFRFLFPRLDYRRNALKYIDYVLENKADGGLFWVLRKKAWVTDISVDSDNYPEEFNLREVVFTLTEKGLARQDDIARELFRWINMLRETGISPRMVEEIQKSNGMEFDHAEEEEPREQTPEIAENIRLYSPEDTLRGPFVLEGLAREELQLALAFMTPRRTQTVLSAPDHGGRAMETETWYGGEYCVERIPEAFLEELEEIAPTKNTIPHNPFLSTQKPVQTEEIDKAPARTETHRLELHHTEIASSKIHATVWIPSETHRTPKESFCARVLANLLTQHTAGLAYLGGLAVLDRHITVDRGLWVSLSGLSEKMDVFVDSFMALLSCFTVDGETFETAREEESKKLAGTDEDAAYKHTEDLIHSQLLRSVFTWEELKQSMGELRMCDVVEMWEQTKKCGGRARAVVSGNISQEGAVCLSERIASVCAENTLGTLPLDIEAPEGKETGLAKKIADKNSAAAVCLLVGHRADREKTVCAHLLREMMEDLFFDQLRTKEQLGYICSCRLENIGGLFFVEFLVQSEKRPEYLQKRIACFLAGMKRRLDAMDGETFAEYVAARKIAFDKKPVSVSEYHHKIVALVEEQTEDFLWERECSALLGRTTLDDVKRLYGYISEDAKSVAVRVCGS
ncbi:MAG: insulin-degrading enzyme [Amphiamblys sp. WSBS2006]|nr:MAG: insulin-degrading enzyme [Amphiamblys sp. WSBS2006]